MTPLHLAARKSGVTVVKFLLGKGANPNAKADDGRTPVHKAAA